MLGSALCAACKRISGQWRFSDMTIIHSWPTVIRTLMPQNTPAELNQFQHEKPVRGVQWQWDLTKFPMNSLASLVWWYPQVSRDKQCIVAFRSAIRISSIVGPFKGTGKTGPCSLTHLSTSSAGSSDFWRTPKNPKNQLGGVGHGFGLWGLAPVQPGCKAPQRSRRWRLQLRRFGLGVVKWFSVLVEGDRPCWECGKRRGSKRLTALWCSYTSHPGKMDGGGVVTIKTAGSFSETVDTMKDHLGFRKVRVWWPLSWSSWHIGMMDCRHWELWMGTTLIETQKSVQGSTPSQ